MSDDNSPVVSHYHIGTCNCCGNITETYGITCEAASEVHYYCLECLKDISAQLQAKFQVFL